MTCKLCENSTAKYCNNCMPIIEIQKKVDLFGWDFDEANILAIKIDEILDDIIRQVRDRESKIVVFINNDHQITNWEILICKK